MLTQGMVTAQAIMVDVDKLLETQFPSLCSNRKRSELLAMVASLFMHMDEIVQRGARNGKPMSETEFLRAVEEGVEEGYAESCKDEDSRLGYEVGKIILSHLRALLQQN